MKLLKYLNEGDELEELDDESIVSLIQKDCKLFLTNNHKDVLLSGRKNSTKYISRKSVRKDRRPVDISPNRHNILNDIFKDAFGVKLRSESIFCTLRESIAEGYGTVYAIFPIGNYEIYWSPIIKDLYLDLKRYDLCYTSLASSNQGFFVLHYLLNPDTDYRAFLSYLTKPGYHLSEKLYTQEEAEDLLYTTIHKIETDKNFIKNEIKKLYKNTKNIDAKNMDKHELMIVCDEFYALDLNKDLNSKELIFKIYGK